MPHAVRTYPASAATVMLPMTVENNWRATVIYCGGSDIAPDRWRSGDALINVAASDSCIKITPETSAAWEEDDPLPEGRVMGNAILLPDGTIFVANGANTVSSTHYHSCFSLIFLFRVLLAMEMTHGYCKTRMPTRPSIAL